MSRGAFASLWMANWIAAVRRAGSKPAAAGSRRSHVAPGTYGAVARDDVAPRCCEMAGVASTAVASRVTYADRRRGTWALGVRTGEKLRTRHSVATREWTPS